jgi:hypothetical protein
MRAVARLLIVIVSFLGGVSACVAQGAPPSDADANASTRLRQDFIVFDPQYVSHFAARGARLSALKAEMVAAESKGIPNVCAHQILFEAGTLLMTTADFKRVDRRIGDLVTAIARPSADKQDADGLWGNCSEQWYLKLDNTFDHLNIESHGRSDDAPPQPMPRFLDRVNTPAKLRAYLDSVAVSDVQHEGVDHGLELNLAISDLLRLLVLGEPMGYKVDPVLHDAFLEMLIGPYRNHQTGFWGERFRRDGREDFVDDISTTFHIVSYLKGKVPEMPQLLDTLFALKSLNSPAGWLSMGQYWNHNNVDVVTEFRYAWPVATAAQRQMIAAEIDRMLSWCLKDSLQPDGSFKLTVGDPSTAYAEYFGTAFLARIGYFNRALRFWTDRDFPEADEVKQRIRRFAEKNKDSDPSGGGYQDVLGELKR